MEIEVDQAELLRRLDRSYRELDTLLSYAATYDPEAPGVCGIWSVKDIVAHLIAHEQRALEELRLARQGKHLDINHAEMDSFNGGAVFAYRSVSFSYVCKHWRSSYQTVVETVQTLDEADFDPNGSVVQALGDTIDGALANNTYAHYDAHGEDIQEWLDNQPS